MKKLFKCITMLLVLIFTVISFTAVYAGGPGWIKGQITDSKGAGIKEQVTVHSDIGDITSYSIGDGYYLMVAPAGTHTLTFTATGYTQGSTYGVVVSQEGTTTLNKTLIPADYTSNTSPQVGTLNVDSLNSTTSTLEVANDTDWFKIPLTIGMPYTIDLEGTPTSMGTLSDPYLRGIYTSTGTLIANTTNDDGGTGYNSRLIFTPPSSGYYYISAGAFSTRTGTYKLSIVNGDGALKVIGEDSSSNHLPVDFYISGQYPTPYTMPCSSTECYTTINGLSVGTYWITGTATGYATQTINPVVITSGNTTTITFNLVPN